MPSFPDFSESSKTLFAEQSSHIEEQPLTKGLDIATCLKA
jgi:hypothetical protein